MNWLAALGFWSGAAAVAGAPATPTPGGGFPDRVTFQVVTPATGAVSATARGVGANRGRTTKELERVWQLRAADLPAAPPKPGDRVVARDGEVWRVAAVAASAGRYAVTCTRPSDWPDR